MKADTRKFAEEHLRLILPFILSVVLSTSLYSVYLINFISGWTLAIIGVCIAMFALCEFINKHHFVGGVIFAVVFMLAFSNFFRLIMGNDYGESFQKWFLTGAEQADTRIDYLVAFLISFVPFFCVVVYYFTNILYRMSFLTLTSLIPFAVYVKVMSEADIVYISIAAILNVALFMEHTHAEQNRNRITVGKKTSLFSACAFSFVLLVISSAIPKEDDARYYEKFEDLFMDNSNNSIKLDDDYSFLSEFSGNADSYRNFTNRRMYSVFAESAPYFKRQTFDYYDFVLDHWYAEPYYSEKAYSAEDWSERMSRLSLSKLQRAIRAADGYSAGFSEKYGLDRVASYSDINDEPKNIFIQSEDFGAVYYLSPARALNINTRNMPYDINVTRGGVFLNAGNIKHDPMLPYVISCYDEYIPRLLWFELGGSDLTDASCTEMLTELREILDENNDPLYLNADAFWQVQKEAEIYKEITGANNEQISERVKALADEITAGMNYDWEKATAFQNYFIRNSYIYDLDYVSRDTSPEHFLFESKRGSCSDYASAFVLLARASGLAARYAEGYMPDITGTENYYVIRDSCSHAYPEVYIQNMGWVVFEPTVPSGYMDASFMDQDNAVNVTIDYDLMLVMCIIAGIILLSVLAVIILYPAVSERLFVSGIHRATAGDGVVMIYKRLCSIHASKLIRNPDACTPYELAGKLEEMTGCDISEAVLMLEEIVYGGKNADENSVRTAMGYYNEAVASIKRYKKENRNNRRMVKHEK